MIPIYEEGTAGRTGYSFQEFADRILEICDEHRAEGRALLFAFVLYDFSVPEIPKVLRDADYWRALDHISGDLVSVFTLHAVAPQDSYRVVRKWLSPVGPVHDPGRRMQLILKTQFGIEEALKLPAILFFQTASGVVLGSSLVQLEGGTTEATFEQLRTTLRSVAEIVRKQNDEGARGQAIFEAVDRHLRIKRAGSVASASIKRLKEVKDILSLARGILPVL